MFKKLLSKIIITLTMLATLIGGSITANAQSPAELYPDFKIVQNPTGTQVHDGQLLVRLDIYPSFGSKTFNQQYVFVIDETSKEYLLGYTGKVDANKNPVDEKDYQNWLDSLPHIWRLNPVLCVFVAVDENINTQSLNSYISQTFNSDTMATIDDIMSRTGLHESAHLISPYMRGKGIISTAKTLSFDQQKRDIINSRLALLSPQIVKADGKIEQVRSESIDVGAGAIDRDAYGTPQTYIDLNNASNGEGILDTFELQYSWGPATDVEVATFYGSGNAWSSRASAAIGTVTYGSKQTFTGKSVAVQVGDFVGQYNSGGTIEISSSGFDGVVYAAGDAIPVSNGWFDLLSGRAMSIYATGTETATGETITFFPRVTIY